MVMTVRKEKVLGFCASIEHAQYMANEFNKRGYKSVCLSEMIQPEAEIVLYKQIRR